MHDESKRARFSKELQDLWKLPGCIKLRKKTQGYGRSSSTETMLFYDWLKANGNTYNFIPYNFMTVAQWYAKKIRDV